MTFDFAPKGIDPDITASLQIYDRLRPVKEALGIKDLTDGEMQVFAMVALHTGLDPFTKQIYAIKRGGRVTHQTAYRRLPLDRRTDDRAIRGFGRGDI